MKVDHDPYSVVNTKIFNIEQLGSPLLLNAEKYAMKFMASGILLLFRYCQIIFKIHQIQLFKGLKYTIHKH